MTKKILFAALILINILIFAQYFRYESTPYRGTTTWAPDIDYLQEYVVATRNDAPNDESERGGQAESDFQLLIEYLDTAEIDTDYIVDFDQQRIDVHSHDQFIDYDKQASYPYSLERREVVITDTDLPEAIEEDLAQMVSGALEAEASKKSDFTRYILWGLVHFNLLAALAYLIIRNYESLSYFIVGLYIKDAEPAPFLKGLVILNGIILALLAGWVLLQFFGGLPL